MSPSPEDIVKGLSFLTALMKFVPWLIDLLKKKKQSNEDPSGTEKSDMPPKITLNGKPLPKKHKNPVKNQKRKSSFRRR